MDYKLKRNRTDKIETAEVVAELKRVAKFYNYRKFTYHEFNKVAETCKGTTVLRIFGSWGKALQTINHPLEERKATRTQISTEELFREMDRIWSKLGHRPSKSEWEVSSPKYSYGGIYKRFSGWTNACLKFIEYKSGGEVTADNATDNNKNHVGGQTDKLKYSTKKSHKIEKSRTIPLSIRVKVLSRDNFKCVFCGKSPAIHPGIILHIDHIKPFSKGGDNSLENLQTLCNKCNLGKSNDEII